MIPWPGIRALFLDGDNLLAIGKDSNRDEKETVIRRIRIKDGALEVMETLRIRGEFVTAFNTNGMVRIVSKHLPLYPSETLEEPKNWLPIYTLTRNTEDKYESGLLTDCDKVYVASEYSGLETITLLSLPISGPFTGDSAVSVMASGPVHITPQSLYVASFSQVTWLIKEETSRAGTSHWLFEGGQVSVHRFDISEPSRTDYAASGTLPGLSVDWVLISEHNGYLWVFATDRWEGSIPSSRIRVLYEVGDRLIEVGGIEDIGRGEQVEYVRFVDGFGYVVTKPKDDPFSIIDLSDPENPARVGELIFSGFSSYLHTIGPNLMLAVGYEAHDRYSVKGGKVSLFDVSDPADPIELSTWIAPETFEDSSWRQLALLWLEPVEMAMFVIKDEAALWSGAIVFGIDGNSITELGRIDHDDETAHAGGGFSTDCRTLDHDPDEVQDDRLRYELLARRVIACEPGEDFIITDDFYSCSILDFDQHEAAEQLDLLADDELLWSCDGHMWSPAVIGNAFVIGDELWTRSGGSLAVHDSTTLERIALIDLTESDEWPIRAFRPGGNE